MKSFIVTAGLILLMGSAQAQRKLTAVTTSRGAVVEHRVTSGESLQYLSTKYGVSLSSLAKANGMKTSQDLRIGQTVKVPVTASNLNTKSRKGIPVYYEAGAKDNLNSISRKFNRVDVKTLKSWNKLRKDDVSKGQDILVGYLTDNAAAKKEKVEDEKKETAKNNTGAALKAGKKVTVTSAVNIRKGASTSQPVVGTLQKDEVVTIVRMTNSDWAEVRTGDGKKGYMATQFLEPAATTKQPEEEKGTAKTPVDLNAGKKVTATSAVNIRRGPGTDEPVIGRVEKDEVVTVTRKINDEWAAIRTNDGKKGYIASQFVEAVTEENNTEKKEIARTETKKATGQKVKAATDTYINIRKGPGTDQPVVGQAQKDEILTLVRRVNDEWAAVRTNDGVDGYAAAQYLIDPSAEAPERPVAKKEEPAAKVEKQMAIVGSGINIRKGPATSEPIVGKAENSEMVTVTGDTNNEWAAIRTSQGITGYIASRFLGTAEQAAALQEQRAREAKTEPAPEAITKTEPARPSKGKSSEPVSSAPVADVAPPPAGFDETGFFKNDYEAQTNAGSTTERSVHAGVFKTDKGWDDGKYYALIDDVPSGTIIKLTNPKAKTTVYAKVLGDIKSLKQKNGPAARISDAAATALRINASDFDVVVSH
ncbi:SH3 domain-containing protein [Niabella sp. CC-SYL272]|uniref:SH3 domain-containing protein n=1 Tax=Niabella agricola TaxID=2891571 RepID=UPI001F2DAF00|nr:SH3 domain-containing protein [Niabella agricola]MCF3108459.1 SH3 domain-containing protein [Niabella agricola]